MAKKLTFNEEMQRAMLSGITQVNDAVQSTLGPAGRTVAIQQSYGAPMLTKDGVTVAKNIELEDPLENMGAQLVKDVAAKTDDVCGDGTTTSTVLAQAIVKEGLKAAMVGVNPIDLKAGMEHAAAAVVKKLHERAKEIETKEEIVQVASVSSNDDHEIGEIIADALEKVGNNGVVTVEESRTTETYTDFVEGMQFDRGYISPYFCTDHENLTVEFTDPYILIYDKQISNTQNILPILEKASHDGRPLLIIADDVNGEALTTLVVNSLRGVIQVCAVKAPGFGDRKKAMLEDIAILTGGDLIDEELNMKLENTTEDNLGVAKTVKVTKDSCTIVDGYGDPNAIKDRVAQINRQIAECDSDYDKEKLKERLARLAGGVAVLRIGATTEVELKEKKHRVEDSINATRAAIEEGVVAGGGTALAQIATELGNIGESDFTRGYNIILKAITRPLAQIAINSGVSGEVVVDKVQNSPRNVGYNALTGEYEDMVAAGIVDPVKVTRSALENAVSVASLILTSNCAITTIPEKKESIPQMNGMQPMM